MTATPKPPAVERRLILVKDQRRKNGARVKLDVLMSLHIAELDNTSLLLGMATTLQIARLDPRGEHHRALADALNIVRLLAVG